MLEIKGVMPVLAVPFHDDGTIDFQSIPKLVNYCVSQQVDALVIFGLASELYTLNDLEREQILHEVVIAVKSRVPIIVGTEHSGTISAVARSRAAENAGASAVMLYPPTFIKPDEANIFSYFKSVGNAVGIPLIIQDAPAWTGVPLSISLLTKIIKEVPNVNYIKLESPPVSEKAKYLKEAGFKVLAGYGAIHLFEDLEFGITGFMPGCSFPGVFVEINRLFNSGERLNAKLLYQKILPLLTFQLTSLDTFIEVQKIILSDLNIFSTFYCREPHINVSNERKAYLKQLINDARLNDMQSLGL